jgi:hypothetical protein
MHNLLGSLDLEEEMPTTPRYIWLCLEASKLKFMYPRNKGGSCRITTDLLPVYAYLNHLFRKTMTSREGDSTTFPPTIKTF